MSTYTQQIPALTGELALSAFFRSHEAEWRKADKRAFRGLDWDDLTDDDVEMLVDIYETLPKGKKPKASKGKPQLTAEEIEAIKRKADIKFLTQFWDKCDGESFESCFGIPCIGLPDDKYGSWGFGGNDTSCDGKFVHSCYNFETFFEHHFGTLMESYEAECPEHLLEQLLYDEHIVDETSVEGHTTFKEQFNDIASQVGYAILARSFLKGKGGKLAEVGSHAHSRRVRTEIDKLGVEGDMEINLKGKAVDTFVEVATIGSAIEKFGVVLDDNQKIILDISDKKSNTKQVKTKPALRRTPIDSVCGCNHAMKWSFQNAVYTQDDEGVWQHTPQDWGCVPCNHKVVDGTEQCSRHQSAEKFVEWTPDMLNSGSITIIN